MTRKFLRNNILYEMHLLSSPCEYGNYFVFVKHAGGYGYLYQDLDIRTKAVFAPNHHGYVQTMHEAITLMNRFENPNIMSTTKTTDSSGLRQTLSNALNHFLGNTLMFTALDVTTKVRQDDESIHVFHGVVKNYVHDEYMNGSFPAVYSRILISIPNANPDPWLYYIPALHDPNAYDGGLVAATNKKAALAPVPTPKTKTKNAAASPLKVATKPTKPIIATFGEIR